MRRVSVCLLTLLLFRLSECSEVASSWKLLLRPWWGNGGRGRQECAASPGWEQRVCTGRGRGTSAWCPTGAEGDRSCPGDDSGQTQINKLLKQVESMCEPGCMVCVCVHILKPHTQTHGWTWQRYSYIWSHPLITKLLGDIKDKKSLSSPCMFGRGKGAFHFWCLLFPCVSGWKHWDSWAEFISDTVFAYFYSSVTPCGGLCITGQKKRNMRRISVVSSHPPVRVVGGFRRIH